ncbi:related to ABC1 family protein YPL109C, mitochondrial [Saccharomycodes ludwigii]|uniref:Related to ABC1 family protein YPL109C, mitochondrial n=1 Tax=Saccharomycodes ludwigii TaxID=36035 RepID=A0A376BA32_9ASCO|nr:related to ABC1 family protein YPL109C, mitochondrial [Saccharomycodes ludwigii]
MSKLILSPLSFFLCGNGRNYCSRIIKENKSVSFLLRSANKCHNKNANNILTLISSRNLVNLSNSYNPKNNIQINFPKNISKHSTHIISSKRYFTDTTTKEKKDPSSPNTISSTSNKYENMNGASSNKSFLLLFAILGLSLIGLFLLQYKNSLKSEQLFEKDLQKLNDKLSLTPDPNAETYEMGLFDSSQQSLKHNTSGFWSNFAMKFVIEPILIVSRFFNLCFIFTPLIISYPFFHDHIKWYILLRHSLEFAGPSFIKLGQWAASRTDIFPENLCDELGKLHSSVNPHNWKYTEKILKQMLHTKDLSTVFNNINKSPIGCGAIAQVYIAEVKQDFIDRNNLDIKSYKNRVCIKIVHPKAYKIIQRDLKIINFFANLIDKLPNMEWLSLPVEAQQFSLFMNLQLDLRIECANLNRFNKEYESNLLVKFPRGIPELTKRNVLFEEYIDSGVPMNNFLSIKKQMLAAPNCNMTDEDQEHLNYLFKKVSDPFIDCFLDMLITNDFIHADLHPGNVIVQFVNNNNLTQIPQEVTDLIIRLKQTDSDQTEILKELLNNYTPRICFIDAGLVTELNDRNRVNFIALFNALATFDGYKAGKLMIERSRTPETAIDVEGFAKKVSKLVDKVKQRTFTLGSVSIGDLLEQMLTMVRKHHVRMEGDFVSVVVAILLLEGIGRQLDPDLDLFARFVFHTQLYGFGNIYYCHYSS